MERARHGTTVALWRHIMPRGVVYFQSAMLSALLIYLFRELLDVRKYKYYKSKFSQ